MPIEIILNIPLKIKSKKSLIFEELANPINEISLTITYLHHFKDKKQKILFFNARLILDIIKISI